MSYTNLFIAADLSIPCWIVIDRNSGKRLYSSFKRNECEDRIQGQIELWGEVAE